MCFACGIENPIGLKLAFYTDQEGHCVARFRPNPEHQGYPGHLHGGLISTLLAEAIGRAAGGKDYLQGRVWGSQGRIPSCLARAAASVRLDTSSLR
jgi:hypothetical protein